MHPDTLATNMERLALHLEHEGETEKACQVYDALYDLVDGIYGEVPIGGVYRDAVEVMHKLTGGVR